MDSVRERLADAGLVLPSPPEPVADYLPATRAGSLVFTAGQLPLRDGELIATGLVGSRVTPEKARECATQCALNALAAAESVCDLDKVEGVVKLIGYVASSDRFLSQPMVIDAASKVMVIAFGALGRHAREAVGVAVLPLDAPVELSLILSVTG